MKLNDCLKKIPLSEVIIGDWIIRFFDGYNFVYNKGTYGESLMIPTTIGIDLLYLDWRGDCNICPDNREFVFGITIAQESTGKCYLVETPCEFTFEQLMREIETTIYKKQ